MKKCLNFKSIEQNCRIIESALILHNWCTNFGDDTDIAEEDYEVNEDVDTGDQEELFKQASEICVRYRFDWEDDLDLHIANKQREKRIFQFCD